MGKSSWLRFYSYTAKILLSKLPVEILLSRRCDLKKIGLYKGGSLKFYFVYFIRFLKFRNSNGVWVQSVMENLVIKLGITQYQAYKSGRMAPKHSKPGTWRRFVVSTKLRPFFIQEETLPIVLEAEWPSWTFWKTRNNSPNGSLFPGNLHYRNCL